MIAACHAIKIISSVLIRGSPKLDLLSEIIFEMVPSLGIFDLIKQFCYGKMT